MERSPFRRLPRELRDGIYELALHGPEYHMQPSAGAVKLVQPYGSTPLALAQTCRQLRTESLPIFFRSSTFLFYTDHIETFHRGYGLRTSWVEALGRWLAAIGDENRGRLRHFVINIGIWDIDYVHTGHRRWAPDKTAVLVWKSLLPALELFDCRTNLVLQARICQEGGSTALLECPLLDAKAAEEAIKVTCASAPASPSAWREVRPRGLQNLLRLIVDRSKQQCKET